MLYEKRSLDENTIKELIELSKEWSKEDITYGYVANDESDLKEPLFVALDNNKIVAYIFGHFYETEKKTSYIEIGSKCFDIDEIYVTKGYRNKGIGQKLFEMIEEYVKNKCEYLTLATSTKNYKKILHFYIEELGMNFHSAFLIKSTK